MCWPELKPFDVARKHQSYTFNAGFDQTKPRLLLYFCIISSSNSQPPKSTTASALRSKHTASPRRHSRAEKTANVQLASFISKNSLNRQRAIIAFKQHKTPVVADVLFLSLLGKAFICPLCGSSASMKNVTFCLDRVESTCFNLGLRSLLRLPLTSLP